MMDFLTQYSAIIGLLFFFAAFVGIALWAFLPKNKEEIESHKNIPLSEDDDDFRK